MVDENGRKWIVASINMSIKYAIAEEGSCYLTCGGIQLNVGTCVYIKNAIDECRSMCGLAIKVKSTVKHAILKMQVVGRGSNKLGIAIKHDSIEPGACCARGNFEIPWTNCCKDGLLVLRLCRVKARTNEHKGFIENR